MSTPNTVIVVVGPRCWGSGQTLQQAVANARKIYSGTGRLEYNAYRASPDFTVDDFGVIEAQKLEKLCEIRYQGDVKITTRPDGTVEKKHV